MHPLAEPAATKYRLNHEAHEESKDRLYHKLNWSPS
jgi:hypothetical protein